ncbi:hypothetical protein ERO13_D12G155166v2 [Gossypium hirsutum]|nr:hypothetical protein ERO13_D12G155166v2 [Gossypium hirsutum]
MSGTVVLEPHSPLIKSIHFLSFPQFLLIFFFSPSSLKPNQHLAYAIMIGCFSSPKVAPNCCSPFPFSIALIRVLGEFPKSHKNTFNF